jgi:Tfp pilus assembly protein PilF
MKALPNKDWYFFGLLLLGVALIYLRSLTNAFLWDDQVVLVANEFIKEWRNVGRLFGSSYFLGSGELSYRPVATFSYLAGHALWGLSRPGFHGLSLFLHLLTGVSAYMLFRELVENKRAAFWGAALFLLHPINTEAVLQVSFNEEILCAGFALSAFYLYLRSGGLDRRGEIKRSLYALSLMCYSLALFSKEVAIVLPVLILSYDTFLRKEAKPVVGIRFWGPHFGYGVVSLFYLWIRFFILRNPKEIGVPYIQDSFFINGLTMGKVFSLYLRQLVWPFHLSPDHHVEIVSRMGDPVVLFSLLGLLGGGAVFVWSLRRSKWSAFFMIWVVLGLLPVMNLIPFLKENYMADRYLYFSSIGFCGLVGYLGTLGWAKKGKPLLILLLLGYGFLTFQRTVDWKDDIHFWGRAVQTDPLSVESHNRLGSAYSQRREFDKAMGEYETALRLNPASTRALNNMGNIFFSTGQYEAALRTYNQSLTIDPQAAVTYANRGSAYQALGQFSQAIDDYERALELKPSFVEVYLNLAVTYEDLRDIEKARQAYQAYLAQRPRSEDIKKRLRVLKSK